MSEHAPIPPFVMLRSFLTVGAGFAVSKMLLFGILAALGYAFFPEFVKFMELDAETQQTIMRTNPAQAIPSPMFWSMIVLNVLANLGIGWLIFKTAPFGHFAHAIFLAVVLFIDYLQIVIQNSTQEKPMTLAYMILFPLAILVGAKWAQLRTIMVESPAMETPNHEKGEPRE